MWDATNGNKLLILEGHTAAIFSVAFSTNGQRIVTGSQDQTAKVWDAVTGTNLLTYSKGHSGRVWSVAFSRDGQRIVSGGWDRIAKVWDAANGDELCTLVGHRGAVLSVAFSPDGRGSSRAARIIRQSVECDNGAVLFTLSGGMGAHRILGRIFAGRKVDCQCAATIKRRGSGTPPAARNCSRLKRPRLADQFRRSFSGWPTDRHGWRGGALFPGWSI